MGNLQLSNYRRSFTQRFEGGEGKVFHLPDFKAFCPSSLVDLIKTVADIYSKLTAAGPRPAQQQNTAADQNHFHPPQS